MKTDPKILEPLLEVWGRKFVVLISLLVLCYTAYSQKEADRWYFGKYAGLNFSNGAPVPLHDGQMVTNEGCATINDKNGNLLFYTNGEKVWNRNHQVMPNGTGLMGGYSSTQSAIVVPFPGNDSMYYIFYYWPGRSNLWIPVLYT